MRKLDVSNPASLQGILKEELSNSQHARYLHRLHCVLLLSQGHSCYELARWFGLSPRSLELWVHKFEQHGVKGLKEISSAGRPAKLNCKQIKELSLIIQYSPSQQGLSANSWSGDLLKRYLNEHFKIDLSVRQCQRLLRQLRYRDLSQ